MFNIILFIMLMDKINSSNQRFNLYQLEDNEYFIKDFLSTSQFIHPINKDEMINLEGNIILTTKSLIFDSLDCSYLMVKFHFRYFEDKPKVVLIKGKDYLKIKVTKLLEIPTNIKNLITHDIKTDLFIHFSFDQLDNILQLLYNTYQSFSNQTKVYEMYSDSFLSSIYSFQFDYSRVKSIKENFLIKKEEIARLILPLIEIPGIVMISDERIYFQCLFKLESNQNNYNFSIKLSSIDSLLKRTVKLASAAIELKYYSKSSKEFKNKLILLQSNEIRDDVYEKIKNQISIINKEKRINLNIELSDIDKYTKLWSEGAISNYEYLIILNSAANRTRLDYSQYPVFPWIITDFESKVLRLNDNSIYRNLSKPIGALNPSRLTKFINRYSQMGEPRYLYGTHYSNPAYVIGYLFRKHPYLMLKLNGGKLEHPDRQFHSIKEDWEVNLTDSGSLKELIPEFYEQDTSFLYNLNNIELGIRSNKEKINNVILPPWANDGIDFLRKNRLSLESNFTNENIHNWIDLIFGYKQQGKEAIESNNVFHNLSYQGNTDLTKVTTFQERKILESQICEFGITPVQLFRSAHPRRFNNIIHKPIILINQEIEKEDKLEIKESKTSIYVEDTKEITELNSNYHSMTLNLNLNTNFKLFSKSKGKSSITSCDIYDSIVTSGMQNGFIEVFRISNNNSIELVSKYQPTTNFPITSIKNLNSNLLCSGDESGTLYIYNHSMNKQITSSIAHNDKINGIFNYDSNLITVSNESFIKKYSLNSNMRTPINILSNSCSILASDYNIYDNILLILDNKRKVSLFDMNKNKEIMEITEFSHNSENINYVKFNPINKNQIFVCSDEAFKVFDIRKHEVVQEIDFFYNTLDIYSDSSKYLLFDRFNAQIYISNYNLESNFAFNSNITCCFSSNSISSRKVINDSNYTYVGCSDGSQYITFS